MKKFELIAFSINLVGIFLCIFINKFVGLGFIISSVFLDKKLILVNLILTPVYETAVVFVEGISLTKVLYSFYIFIFILYFYKNKNIKLILIDFLVLFSILLVLGLVNVSYYYETGVIDDFPLLSMFFYYFSRVVLFFLFFNYLINKSEEFIVKSTNYLCLALIFVIPFLIFYFQANSIDINWYNKAQRTILAGSDPNELSIIIISLFPFFLFKKKLNIIFKVLLAFGCSYLLFSFASRSSLVLLLLLIILFPFYYFSKNKNIALYFLLLFVVSNILFEYNVFDNFNMINRFVLSNDINDVTGNRFNLYKASLQGFLENPIIGYGPSNSLAAAINFKNSRIDLVSHNIILEFLMTFGIIGVLAFIYLYTRYNKYFIREKNHITKTFQFSLLFLLVGSLSLSWLWREILWVTFAIYFALNYLRYKKRLYENTSNNTIFN